MPVPAGWRARSHHRDQADSPPTHPTKALQILVSHARTLASAEAIARSDSGYRLNLADEDVDIWALASLLSGAEEALANGATDRALESAETAATLGNDARQGESSPSRVPDRDDAVKLCPNSRH